MKPPKRNPNETTDEYLTRLETRKRKLSNELAMINTAITVTVAWDELTRSMRPYLALIESLRQNAGGADQ